MRQKAKIFLLLVSAALAVCLPGCGDRIDGEEEGVALEWVDGQWVQRTQRARGAAEASLENVRRLFENGNYFRAVQAAKRHVKSYAGDLTNEEAYHLAGRSELGRNRYYQAYEFFEHQLDEFPGGTFFERGLQGQLTCAEAFMAGKRRVLFGIFRIKADEEAVIILEGIAEHAPGTRMAERVLLQVADYQFDRGEYEEAADAYDRFMELFPRSVHGAHVLQRAAESSSNMYLGAAYDDTPLLDAAQRYEMLAEQFPERAAAINVDLILEDIRSARAAKVYDSAAFYERTNHPRSAVYYYQQVIERFPGTESARRSQQALARLDGSQMDMPIEPVDTSYRPRRRPPRPPAPGADIGPVGAQ